MTICHQARVRQATARPGSTVAFSSLCGVLLSLKTSVNSGRAPCTQETATLWMPRGAVAQARRTPGGPPSASRWPPLDSGASGDMTPGPAV